MKNSIEGQVSVENSKATSGLCNGEKSVAVLPVTQDMLFEDFHDVQRQTKIKGAISLQGLTCFSLRNLGPRFMYVDNWEGFGGPRYRGISQWFGTLAEIDFNVGLAHIEIEMIRKAGLGEGCLVEVRYYNAHKALLSHFYYPYIPGVRTRFNFTAPAGEEIHYLDFMESSGSQAMTIRTLWMTPA